MLSDSIKSLQSTIFIWVWSCHYNSSALCRWLDRYWRWYVWISELKSHVSQYFEMKDLNTLTYFLAHEVSLNDGDYCHTQAKYACHLLLMQVWRAILLFKLLLNQMLNSLSYIGEHLMILLYRKFCWRFSLLDYSSPWSWICYDDSVPKISNKEETQTKFWKQLLAFIIYFEHIKFISIM